MPAAGERWPPVYDADDLLREIRRLADHADMAEAFYEWRRDRSTRTVEDVCQGDIVRLGSEVPVILEDGQPGLTDHPDGVWLVVGNTCDFDRTLGDARWTQLVPVWSIGTQAGLTATQLTAVRKYTQARSFHVPAWSADAQGLVYVADFLRPVGVDKRVLSGPTQSAVVQARLSRAGWILLNACLVRFLARDDGRYA